MEPKRMKTKATDPLPTPTLAVPPVLADTTDPKGLMDRVRDSEFVDHITNAAAVVVREKGQANKDKLAKRIDKWIDQLAQAKGWRGRIVRMLPLKGVIAQGLDALIDAIADWLEDVSDATDEKAS